MAKRILIVDDDNGVRTLLSAVLMRSGYQHDIAVDGEEAVARLRRGSYDAILLDLMMPITNGFEVLQFLRAEQPAMVSRVIVLTAASPLTLRDFDTARLHALVRKPFDVAGLMEMIEECCNQRPPSVEQASLSRPPAEGLDS